MRQFDREDELDRMLAAGRIGPSALDSFGRQLAGIHEALPAAAPDAPWGRAAQVRTVVLENLEQCSRAVAGRGDSERLVTLRQELPDRLERLAPLIEQRRAAGRVRECHGDLHARNVVLRNGRLLAFDCMEFSDAFRWIDVADEVAFLLADLKVRGWPIHAHAFLSGYLVECGDYAACRVLDVYEAHRALVRAKVTALGWANLAQGPEVVPGRACREYQAYVDAAQAALGPRRPFLVLVSGLSGSGKTWLANRLVPQLGAIHLRSDVERKRLAGLAESARTSSPVRQGLYSPAASARVYEHLAHCAAQVASGGYPALVDATFNRREDRARFRALAISLGLSVRFLHCRAAPEVLRRRLALRHALGSDPSEADLEVLRWQEHHAEPVTPDEGFVTLEVDTTADDPAPPLDKLFATLRA
jgi:predicted kinase